MFGYKRSFPMIKSIRSIRSISTSSLNKNKNAPVLPQFEFAPDQYKCHLSNYEIERIHKLNLNPVLTTCYKKPIVITQGRMQYVYDSDGKRYLDMFGGIVTTSVGHCHPKLVEAATKQLSKLWHTSSIYLYEEVHEFASKLCNQFPEPLNNVFFVNSGSEANDLAMLMARLYTKSFDVVSLRNAYHGCSPYNMSLCGVGNWKHSFPNSFGVHQVTNPDPYRGRFGGAHCRESLVQTTRNCACSAGKCEASDKYIEDVEDLFNTSLPKKIAGMFVESIQGVGGVVQFPKDYLKRAQSLVKARDGLMILDEVQTGFGRTGVNYWGFQSHGIIPDIVTMAKGIGNGFPLAAVVTRSDIAAAITDASFFNTFGGNPLSSKVGSTVLDIIEEESLQHNSLVQGELLIRGLERLRSKYNIIGDVRGQGLMIGLDMVSNEVTRAPLPKAEFDRIFEDCRENGLLLGRGGAHGNVFRITPPMCITEQDVEFTIEVLDLALQNYGATRS